MNMLPGSGANIVAAKVEGHHAGAAAAKAGAQRGGEDFGNALVRAITSAARRARGASGEAPGGGQQTQGAGTRPGGKIEKPARAVKGKIVRSLDEENDLAKHQGLLLAGSLPHGKSHAPPAPRKNDSSVEDFKKEVTGTGTGTGAGAATGADRTRNQRARAESLFSLAEAVRERGQAAALSPDTAARSKAHNREATAVFAVSSGDHPEAEASLLGKGSAHARADQRPAAAHNASPSDLVAQLVAENKSATARQEGKDGDPAGREGGPSPHAGAGDRMVATDFSGGGVVSGGGEVIAAIPSAPAPVPQAPDLDALASQLGARVSVSPGQAQISLDTGATGDLSLYLRVRGARTDVRVEGAAAHLVHDRVAELKAALSHEGLSLGNFDMGQHARGNQEREFSDPEAARAGVSSGTAPALSPSVGAVTQKQSSKQRLHITA